MKAHSAAHRFAGFRTSRIATIATALAFAAIVLAGHATPAAAQATAMDSTATLQWTAPGDDGMSGRASRYEIRYSNQPIAGTDTTGWWSGAATVPNLPAPNSPGVTDSVRVRGLDPHVTWYFVLRTADEVPNWSNFSDVATRPPYVDRTPPLAITDLTSGGSIAAPVPPASMRGGSTKNRY